MPKIVYFVTEDWFFVSHFLPMGRAARQIGFEVVVVTRVRAHRAQIEAEGFRLIAVDAERGSLSAVEGFRSLLRSIAIIRAERADLVHCIALRLAVIGGIAARLCGAPALILAPTGLGHLLVEQGPVTRLLRGLVRVVVGRCLRSKKTHYVFENRDDPPEFWLDPDGPEVTIVGGAGVDPAEFPMQPERAAQPVKIAVVARMIWPKGIAEAVEATRHARAQGASVELHLFGGIDPANRRPIPIDVLQEWSREPGIRWHGATADVPRVWREHDIALLLTYYREGLPRTLIEAAASGRPIVTTDAPGCRNAVRDGVEGFLVPPRDVKAAAQALVTLAADPDLRSRMGKAANKRFQEKFTVAAVQQTIGALYRTLARYRGSPP
jgi:glycosyltransferase involved in cell wall biosynthesis